MTYLLQVCVDNVAVFHPTLLTQLDISMASTMGHNVPLQAYPLAPAARPHSGTEASLRAQ